MKEIKRFNEDVLKSEQMQNEIKEIGNDLEKIIEYANSKGYEFTVEDVKKYSQKNVELTDKQLDSVSGGAIVTGIVTMIVDPWNYPGGITKPNNNKFNK